MITLLPDSATLDDIASVVAAGDVPLVGDSRWPRAQWDALRALDGEVPEHVAWATLTSGSSGSSRVVLRTAASWRDSFAAVSRLLGGAGAVFLPAPPSASMTLFSLAHALDGGPRPVLSAADDTVTAFHGTPHALRALLDVGAPPRLRDALVGGSHVDPRLRADAEAAGIRATAYYGAAELSFVAIDEGEGLRAFPGVELAVRDGVLWVNSPYVALGYLGSTGPLRRDGAWATVGDRADLTDGTIRLLGRADDAILSASATIVPEEVEAALRTIPGITDAVVFALPRPRVGSLVAALIEHDGTVTDLKQACAERLTISHRPRAWYSGTIPRTASGKPARAEVVQRALAGEIDRYVL